MDKTANDKLVNYAKFNFDVSAYRLLGRELITDRITALYEIVKNAYDANATRVTVEFKDINPLSKSSKIIITDDGHGMELSDLLNKWMVIGTSSKRRERISPSPYNRKVVGKKGIGRFAVDLLGAKLTLRTKKSGAKQRICLETDWSYYTQLENLQLKLPFEVEKEFFTDIENKYWFENIEESSHGTVLEIENINDEWTENDIIRAYRELSRLVSPFTNIEPKYPFHVIIKSPYKAYEQKEVKPLIIDYASHTIELKFDKIRGVQQTSVFEKGRLTVKESVPRVFGYITFYLYYFDQNAKRKFKDQFGVDIDGIKIYRDGIITTPFAETESSIEKQKDILGIDKRRYSGFFDRLNSRDLLGFLELTDENNPNIIEATNRQDFLDNKEWKELKLFIIEQIQQLEKLLKYERENIRLNTKSDLGSANAEFKSIKKEISDVRKNAPVEVQELLQKIEAKFGKLQGTVNKGIRDYAKLEEETKQKEQLFFSLVSLQTYAAMFSHMTKHTIGHVLRDAEYFKNHFPNEKLSERFKTISKRIFTELITLRTGIDFMLKYAKSDNELEDINLYELVDNLFNHVYSDLFRKQGIHTAIELKDNLILTYNRKALEDIFDNLISNSIKALKGVDNKKIKCSGFTTKNELIVYFSDNGIGIPPEDKLRIFDIFFTTTAETGGAGIGLYMVKTRIESMQGKIEVTKNEFLPSGATFEITLPFKK